jgi:ABC-type sugar transport system ATPase subunit
MIEIEGLEKNYGKTQALDGIDLYVSRGELFAYLGLNGAGKTTTTRILTGLTRQTAGTAPITYFSGSPLCSTASSFPLWRWDWPWWSNPMPTKPLSGF